MQLGCINTASAAALPVPRLRLTVLVPRSAATLFAGDLRPPQGARPMHPSGITPHLHHTAATLTQCCNATGIAETACYDAPA